MANFVDEYPRQLDERGRIVLPSKVRDKMSDTVYVTRSVSDKCLHLYTQEEWDKISAKAEQLPITTDRRAAAFSRTFFGTATCAVIDKQGRVPIAKRLAEYAGLVKDVVLVGVNTRLEIWDSKEWEEYQSSLGLYDDIMLESVREYGFNI